MLGGLITYLIYSVQICLPLQGIIGVIIIFIATQTSDISIKITCIFIKFKVVKKWNQRIKLMH